MTDVTMPAPSTCVDCVAEVSYLEVFPGPRCLACYAKTPEANAPITSDDVVRLWGGPVRRTSRRRA